VGEIRPFKMTKHKAQQLVARLAKNSSNITFINECTDGEWERSVNFRQMQVCLQEGDVLSNPWWDDESKTHRCRMGRFHAGQDIVLEVAIEEEQHLYVVNVCQ
jgi:hypothetical protein